MTDAHQGPAIRDIIARYDRGMYENRAMQEYFGSDFANFGWWEPDTKTHRQACEQMMEHLLARIPQRTGRILDVACGKGMTTRHLTRYYPPADVTAINVSAKQLETARENAPGCHLVLMDAARLAFDDDAFDAVVCVEAAFHFDTREGFLHEARRVLRPGGRLVVADLLMTREAERRRPLRSERNFLEGPDAYRALCHAAGFTAIEVTDVTEECWRRAYHDVVRFFHEKLLAGLMTTEEVKRTLDVVYQLVPDVECYLVVAATKPRAA
jgi:MPBQ/MSBQ methyltransferase